MSDFISSLQLRISSGEQELMQKQMLLDAASRNIESLRTRMNQLQGALFELRYLLEQELKRVPTTKTDNKVEDTEGSAV